MKKNSYYLIKDTPPIQTQFHETLKILLASTLYRPTYNAGWPGIIFNYEITKLWWHRLLSFTNVNMLKFFKNTVAEVNSPTYSPARYINHLKV